MKGRKAIFDKRISKKKTIMALYTTKILFSEPTVFGDYVQKQKKKVFGVFSQRQEADT